MSLSSGETATVVACMTSLLKSGLLTFVQVLFGIVIEAKGVGLAKSKLNPLTFPSL